MWVKETKYVKTPEPKTGDWYLNLRSELSPSLHPPSSFAGDSSFSLDLCSLGLGLNVAFEAQEASL